MVLIEHICKSTRAWSWENLKWDLKYLEQRSDIQASILFPTELRLKEKCLCWGDHGVLSLKMSANQNRPAFTFLSSREKCCRRVSAGSQVCGWSCNAIKGPPASLVAINGVQPSFSFNTVSPHTEPETEESLLFSWWLGQTKHVYASFLCCQALPWMHLFSAFSSAEMPLLTLITQPLNQIGGLLI